MAKYFGTNGIRGKLDEMTPEFACRMAAAFGIWSGRGKILVGRDTRTSGQMLSNAVCAGLISAGCEVLELGVVPAPTVELMVHKLGADGAITITASHNPPEWNALKFVDSKCIAVSPERGEGIEKIFEKATGTVEWNKIRGKTAYYGAIGEHVSTILANVDAERIRRRKLKIVLDCGNGTAGLIAPRLFRQLGCRVLTLNAQPDGFFPGRNSEPTRENIRDLIESVKATGADMGIAWDGDADRVIFIDEKGGYIIGDKSFALSAKLAMQRNRRTGKRSNTIVTTVATTDLLKDIAREFAGEVVYTKVGGPYIAEKVAELNSVSGGEEAGGVIWPDVHIGKDGILTAARIAEAVCDTPLSRLIASLPRYFNAKTKIMCGEREKLELVERMKREEGRAGKATLIDGIRVDYKDGWCIMRASGTENLVRIFAEAKSAKKAGALAAKWKKKVEGWMRNKKASK
ncbi:MAG: phosphoglucosamine mutase [Candidatus Micrarchaeota archaeon]|nr:phosphoglucosamine mutase [Candidatus Micrarchaeota archaeon]